MGYWTLDDIPWDSFDAGKVSPRLTAVVKAASMVESNGYDFARYLHEVFADDFDFQRDALEWAKEEVQHGQALRRWTELADPSFDFTRSFQRFTHGYQLPRNVDRSVRGSRCGELIARCIVETGTSSYYTAIKEATGEPVLQTICSRIAADEFRHYKLFYTHLKRYLARENIGFMRRMFIALGRIAESEDDELAYAYYAANAPADAPYHRRRYSGVYMRDAFRFYRPRHIQKMTSMVFKAIGITPHRLVRSGANYIAWQIFRWRAQRAMKA